MNIEKYSILHNEIMKRLEDGKITVENVKEVNDLAFDKYIMERGQLESKIKSKLLEVKNIDELYNVITKDVKLLVNFIEKDSSYNRKIKAKIKSELKRAKSEIGEDTTELEKEMNKYKFTTVPHKQSDLFYIEIVNGPQEARIMMEFIIKDIINVIRSKYKSLLNKFNVDINSGDGDEGCLYIESNDSFRNKILYKNNKTITEADSSIKNSKFKFKNVIVDIDTEKADINIDLKPHLDIIESNWNKIITEAVKWCIKHAKDWNMPNDKSEYRSKLKLTEICYLGGNKNHFFTAFTGPSNLDGDKFFDGHQLYIDLYIDIDKKTVDISDSISI